MRIPGFALHVLILSAFTALPASAGAAVAAATPAKTPVITAPGTPEAQPSAAELALATRYASGMQGVTEALEKVVEAQANQISMISWMVAAFGLGLTLAGFGIYAKLRSAVRDAVDDRVAAVVTSVVDVNNTRSAKLHAAFLETTFSASRDIARSRERDLRARISSGQLDLTTPGGVERLVKLQSEVLLFPLFIVSTIYALAAGDDDVSGPKEKVWVLFGEVAAGHITPRAMLELVTALINILHHRKTRPVVLSYLKAFAKQLREAIDQDILPESPAF